MKTINKKHVGYLELTPIALTPSDNQMWIFNNDIYVRLNGITKKLNDQSGGGGGISLTDLSASTPISYDNTTGAFSIADRVIAPIKLQGTGNTATTFYRGDGTWVVPTNTTYIELTEAEITAGTDTALRTITGRRAGFMTNRANHTGTQLASTISDFQTQVSANTDVTNSVKKTGNETIADVKTFSSSPIVPTPTTDYQAVTKKYVDDGNKLFTISLNFIDLAVATIKAPGSMKINSITKESGTPTIKVNGSAYTLGASISQYDEIEVTATVDTLVILNCEKI